MSKQDSMRSSNGFVFTTAPPTREQEEEVLKIDRKALEGAFSNLRSN